MSERAEGGAATPDLWPRAKPNTDEFGTLRHKNLDGDALFEEMKGLLILTYNEQMKPKEKRRVFIDKSAEWRRQFVDSLHELLGEVVFTSDPIMQRKVLGRVYSWYTVAVKGKLPSPMPKTPISQMSEYCDQTFSRLSTNNTPFKDPDFIAKKANFQSLEARAVEKMILPNLRPKTSLGEASRVSLKPMTHEEKRAKMRMERLKKRQLLELKALKEGKIAMKKWNSDQSRFEENSAFKIEQSRALKKQAFRIQTNDETFMTDKASPDSPYEIYNFTADQSPSYTPIELYRDDIDRYRKAYSKVINVADKSRPVNTFDNSLSVYSNTIDYGARSRPLTGSPKIRLIATRSQTPGDRCRAMSDVYAVKSKLSYLGIPVSLKHINSALVKPQDDVLIDRAKTPSPSALLIDKPFRKKGKKKRAKKGKKAKKTKK